MKKEYIKPNIKIIKLDSAISLQLESYPTIDDDFEVGGSGGRSNIQRQDPYQYDDW